MVESTRYSTCQLVAIIFTFLVPSMAAMTNPYVSGSGTSDAACEVVKNDSQMVRDAQLPSNSSPNDCLPNALMNWPQITQRIGNRPIAIFLDYDGTLSPHVPDPEKATISEEMRSVLETLSNLYAVSIITGRPLKTIRRFLSGMDHLYYAASHGLDITFDSADHERIIIAKNYIPYLNSAFGVLKTKIGHVEGCILENNGLSVSVHYRKVQSEADKEKMNEAVKETLNCYRSHIKLINGEKVWELRPSMDWDKGKAVEYILEKRFPDPSTVAVYLGDDTTDEDAFKVVRQLQGISVLVNKQKKVTTAEYTVADPSAVLEFLKHLAEIAPSSQRD